MTSPRPVSPLRARSLAVLSIGLCLAPYLVCYGEVGFLSEDFTALVYASDLGRAASDLTGPQYGLAQPLFYRPWVTLSLGWEAALCGHSPALLKLSHLLALAVAFAALRALARRAGLGNAGALLAMLLAAWFPFGAGSALWLVGRVDAHLLGFGLLYLAGQARAQSLGEAEGSRGVRIGSALGAHLALLLALGTKETAIALAPIAFAFGLLRGDAPPRRRWLRAALLTAPAFALTGAFLAWRARCLGTWIGGYAGGELLGGAPFAALARKLIDLPAAFGDLVLLLPLTWLGRGYERTPLLVSVVLGLVLLGCAAGLAWRRSAPRDERQIALLRVSRAGLLWALLACGPLLPLWGDPAFATNARAYWLAWCGLALALAALCSAWPRLVALPVGAGALAVALLGLARNVADHVQASRAVEALRAEIARAARSRPGSPVIVEEVPKSVGSAYALTFGLREAVRSPFASSACEIAAWRPLFPAAPPLPALPEDLRAAFAPGATAAAPEGAVGVGWSRLDGSPPHLSGELAFAWFAEWQALQGAPRSELLARLPALELPRFGPRVRLGFLTALGSASAELALPAEPRSALSLVEIFVLAPILTSGEGALYVPLEVLDKGGDRIWIYAESLDERGAPNGPTSALLELRFTPSFSALLRPR